MTATIIPFPIQPDFEPEQTLIPAAANDNEPDFGDWSLPALQRAAQGKLMATAEENDVAAITLARLWRVWSGEAVVSSDIVAVIDDEPDEERVPPNVDSLMTETIPFNPKDPDSLREMLDLPMKVIARDWYNRVTGTIDRVYDPYVFLRGRWVPYGQEWGDERESVTLPPGYKIRKAQIQATRQQLKDLDHLDREAFRDIVGEDVMCTIDLFVEGKNMEEIGAAFGFKGKQAEAVGKDRIRTAVRAAQRAFDTIEASNKAGYWWEAPPRLRQKFARQVERKMAA